MSYGVINGPTGSYRILPGRTKLAIDSIVAANGVAAGATPDTFTVSLLGLHQINLNINLSSPSNNVPFILELWNVTLGSVIQQRACVAPGQAFPSDQYFGFEWVNASATDEYAFYITPDPGVFYKDYALLFQDLNFRAVVQEFAGGMGNGTAGKIPVWTGASTLGDSIMTEAGSAIVVAGSVNLAGNNTTTFLSLADGQNAPVSAANTARMRYNNATHVIEVSENGAAWHDLVGVAAGTVDTVAKFNAPNSVSDSNITSVPTAVEITQASAAGGSPTAFTVFGGAHTALAAGVEAPDIDFDLARTVQFATGAVAVQRAVVIQAPTYSFVGASTITQTATLTITGAPIQGANATLTNASALWIPSGIVNIGLPNNYDAGIPLQVALSSNAICGAVLVNRSAANAASMQWWVENDGAQTLGMGIRGTGYAGAGITTSGRAFVNSSAPLVIGTTSNDDILFFTNGDLAARERMRITNAGVVQFGLPGTLSAQIAFANATNANLVTVQSGVTAASYTLTLPLAQGGVGTVLTNSGAGVLTWGAAGTIGGGGTINTIPKFTAANTIGDGSLSDIGTGITQTQVVAVAGSPTAWTLNAAAHTTLAAGVEAIDVNFDLARTVQFATGAIAVQRAFVIQSPTYDFVAASTITEVATVTITGAPIEGANATFGNYSALWVPSGTVHVGLMNYTDSASPLQVTLNEDAACSVDLYNLSAGTDASMQLYIENDDGLVAEFGLRGSLYASGGSEITSANLAFLTAQTTLVIGTTAMGSGEIKFFTNGDDVANERMQITNLGVIQFGLPSTLNAQLALANATNNNLVTIQSGVTGANYTLTVPTAQGGANTFLRNDGAGALSWSAGGASGTGTVNVIPKVTNATGPVYGDSSLTDNGTNITGLLPIRLGPTAVPADFGSLFEAVYSAPAKNIGFNTVLSGDVINSLGAVGYHSGGAFATSASAKIQFAASEDFTAIARGTNINFWVTPIGSVTAIEGFQVTAAGVVRIGAPATSTGQLAFTNATNANLVTLQSGVTSANYTLTVPTAQGGANTFLRNDGAGALSWAAGGASGSGTANVIPKCTNATGPVYGDSSLTDNGTNITGLLPIRLGPTAAIADRGDLFEAVYSAPARGYGVVSTMYSDTHNSTVSMRRARGTSAAPTAVLANDVLSSYGVFGLHSGGAFTTQSNARIQFTAAENFTAIAQGSNINFWVTPIGGVAAIEAFQVTAAGVVRVGSPSTSTGNLAFANVANANLVTLQSGVTSASYTLTFPTAVATANGQALTSTTLGVMSWTTIPSGTGTINVIPKITNSTGPAYGDSSLTDIGTGITQAQTVATSGSPNAWLLTAAAHTTLAAGVEATDVNLNLARTVQFATGAITEQRAVRIQAPTYAFVAASVITRAATLAITGAPIQGLNATLTDSYALWVESGKVALGSSLSATGILEFHNSTNSNEVIFQSGITGVSYTLTLPTAQSSGTKYLQNDGSGNLSWAGAATGTGTLNFIPKVTNATGPVYGNSRISDNGTTITLAQAAASGGTPNFMSVTTGNQTGVDASSEIVDVNFNLSHTIQHNTGALALQRAFLVQAPTYSFIGASTITEATTVAITGAPIQGANCTITNAWALHVTGATKITGKLTVTGGIDPTYLELAGANTDTYLNLTDGQNVPISAANQGRMRYNTALQTFQFSENGGAWTDLTGVGPGTVNRLSKFSTTTTIGDSSISDTGTSVTQTQTVATSGSPNAWLLTAAAHTTLAAGAECIDVYYNLNRTVQFAAGAIATQRAVVFTAPTYAFVGASTVTSAATVAIAGAPVQGLNATLTNAYALWIQSGTTNIGGGLMVKQVTKLADYPATVADNTILCDPTAGGTFTVTLPSAVGIAGQMFTVKHIGTANNVIVSTAGGTIDGDASTTLVAKNSLTVISDGANYFII
jgi:hypothetical protein